MPNRTHSTGYRIASTTACSARDVTHLMWRKSLTRRSAFTMNKRTGSFRTSIRDLIGAISKRTKRELAFLKLITQTLNQLLQSIFRSQQFLPSAVGIVLDGCHAATKARLDETARLAVKNHCSYIATRIARGSVGDDNDDEEGDEKERRKAQRQKRRDQENQTRMRM